MTSPGHLVSQSFAACIAMLLIVPPPRAAADSDVASPAEAVTAPVQAPPTTDHRAHAGLAVGGVYAGFAAWAYLAWYRNRPEADDREIGGDGWFGARTYAGGADKLGHAWATMTLARGGTAALRAGGWSRRGAALVSALLAEGLFVAVEIKDYVYFELSPGDLAFDTIGAVAAVAMDNWPRLDELFDFRVEYWPSKQYRYNLLNADSPCAKRVPGQPSCSRWNIAEDYSGETYVLAFHLGALRGLRESSFAGWSRFVDIGVGFKTRDYKPPPTLEPPDVRRTQTLFIGASLNVQGIIDHLLPTRSKLRAAGHGLFEVLAPPLSVPLFGVERGTRAVERGGA